jgi:RND family efflux transporter MFP subunit
MAAHRNLLVAVTTRIAVGAFVLALGFAVFTALFTTRPRIEPADNGPEPPRVPVIEVEPVVVHRQRTGFGVARAMDTADVPVRVTATVIEIPPGIEAGAWIGRGDLLARLDASDFERQVEIFTETIQDIDAQLDRLEIEEASWNRRAELANEQVELARVDYERVKSALTRRAAKEREVDQVRQALIAAIRDQVAVEEEQTKIAPRRASLQALRASQDASLRLASQNVERCTISSPLDGYLEVVDVEVGENLQAGQRIARVVNTQLVEVPVRLPAGARRDIAVGDPVELRGTGSAPRTWHATVSRLSPADDDQTRTMTVYVEISADDLEPPAPGMFLEGRVESSRSATRVVVPRRALQGGRIMVIEDGRVRRREVEVDFHVEADLPGFGLIDRQWTVLSDGLPAGTLVVVNGAGTMSDGTLATPVVSSAAAADAR